MGDLYLSSILKNYKKSKTTKNSKQCFQDELGEHRKDLLRGNIYWEVKFY